MNFLKELSNALIDGSDMKLFLNNHFQEAVDFCLFQKTHDLFSNKKSVESFFYKHLNIILDLDSKRNSKLMMLLLELSSRIENVNIFTRLYRRLRRDKFVISHKHQAVFLYTSNIREYKDYYNVIDEVLEKLSKAGELEEDNFDDISFKISQFYYIVVKEYGKYCPKEIIQFKNKILDNRNKYEFLNSNKLKSIFDIPIDDFENACKEIECGLDNFLKVENYIIPVSKQSFFIEKETNYCSELLKVGKSFSAVRKIALDYCDSIQTSDSIYYSLGRGVKILSTEEQLYMYVKSYGNAHYAKIISALEEIDLNRINSEIQIIDWGCGQALASMIFLEYIKKLDIKVNKITLIEPSMIALKRGSLHIKHLISDLKINTICKKLDDLSILDISNNEEMITINLFSNILDIDNYNQVDLIKLIEKSLKGENYFICVSPDINEIKTERLIKFSSFFEEKYHSSFKKYADFINGGGCNDEYWCCNNKFKGQFNVNCNHIGNGCNKKWTRVVKAFSVNFENNLPF